MAGNHLDEAIGGWCPSCRSAFGPGVERCDDCDVELVGELPPAPPRRRLDAQPDDAVEYELGDWRDDQRDGLTLLLQVSEVPFTWAGTVLTVPPSAEAEVDALVDEIDGGADLSLDATPELDPPSAMASPPVVLAERWRRLAGAVVDGLVPLAVSVLVAFTVRSVDDLWRWWVTTELAWLANVVGGTALFGRSLGKLVAGTRVVTLEDGAIPGWRRAVIRWLVESAPSLVAAFSAFSWVGRWLSPTWAIAVHAPILGADRRGLHDRAAGTIVVRTR